jgi:hypothetical protein
VIAGGAFSSGMLPACWAAAKRGWLRRGQYDVRDAGRAA